MEPGLNTDVAIAPSVLWTQRVAVGSLVGLVVLSLGWELWWAPIRPGGSWLALKALPLCIPLAGLLKRRLYTYRWVSLLVWLYFIEGVVRAWSDPMPSRLLAAFEIALCLSLFAACAAHVRVRFQHARQLAQAQADDPTPVAPAHAVDPPSQGAPHV